MRFFPNKRIEPLGFIDLGKWAEYSCERLNGRDIAVARDIVKHQIPKLDADGITKESDKTVRVIISCNADDSLMMHLGRKAALDCHFPNFNEKDGSRRTKITFLAEGRKSIEDLEIFRENLSAVSGNLMGYCPWTCTDVSGEKIQNPNALDFVDVEIEIIALGDKNGADFILNNIKTTDNEIVSIMVSKDSCNKESIESLRKKHHSVAEISEPDEQTVNNALRISDAGPKMVLWVYTHGEGMRSINERNIGDAKSYETCLKAYVKSCRNKHVDELWKNDFPEENNSLSSDEIQQGLNSRMKRYANIASNILCYDGYEYRLRSVGCNESDSLKEMKNKIRENLVEIARTEHARWIVEKLIYGFKPFSNDDMYKFVTLSAEERKEMKKQMKECMTHLNICSWKSLQDLDPDAVKYDIFLMQTVPVVISKTKTPSNK